MKTYTFPFLPILTLIFVIAKLTGAITWSWLWVFSPILAIPIVIASLLVIYGMVFLFSYLFLAGLEFFTKKR